MAFYFGKAFWSVKDPAAFQRSMGEVLESLRHGAEGVYFSDQLFTWGRNLSFLFDEKFIVSFKKHVSDEIEEGVLWRRAVHYWAAQHCRRLEGDFVECGVWKGTTVHIMYDAVDFGSSGKNYWLYDAFDFKEGDLHHTLDGLEQGLYEKVVERFSFAPNVKIVQGYIPDSFSKGTPESVSLLHVDMNNAPAEVAALETLWDRVVPGGIVLLDDFGWGAYANQTYAELDFFKARDHFVLELPTGQGLVIKHGK